MSQAVPLMLLRICTGDTGGGLRRYRNAGKTNFQLIEHLLRRGKRQVDMLKQPDVSGVVV